MIGFSSCQLQETPYSSIFTDNFYKTAGDAEAGITSVYGGLADLYGGPAPFIASDFSADQEMFALLGLTPRESFKVETATQLAEAL